MDTLTSPRHLRLHTSDNVVVAVDAFQAGQHVEDVTVKDRVPRGHKLASKPIALGEPVRKFGQIIGSASKPIAPGEWVHEHNLDFSSFARQPDSSHETHAGGILPIEQQATFQGFRRANGRAGTRNYIGVLTSVKCNARGYSMNTRRSTASFHWCMAAAARSTSRAKATRCSSAPSGAMPPIRTSPPC